MYAVVAPNGRVNQTSVSAYKCDALFYGALVDPKLDEIRRNGSWDNDAFAKRAKRAGYRVVAVKCVKYRADRTKFYAAMTPYGTILANTVADRKYATYRQAAQENRMLACVENMGVDTDDAFVKRCKRRGWKSVAVRAVPLGYTF